MAQEIHAVASLAVIASEVQENKNITVEFSIQKASVFFTITKADERILNIVEPISALNCERRSAQVISNILLVIEEHR